MRIPLFINPTAGRGRAAASLPAIVSGLAASGIELEVHESRAKSDLETQIFRAANDGVPRLIVAGGDGSMHEAANGLTAAGKGTALGLIPVGTGNDFAKALSIPIDPQHAARELGQRIARNQLLRRVDIGLCNGRAFSNGCGIGIDAKVASIAAGVRLPMGNLVYLVGILRCLWDGIATPHMDVLVDGATFWSGPTTLTNISNGPWVGGQFHIAPNADPSDAHLDVVIAAAVSRLRVLKLLPALTKGRHLSAPELQSTTGTSITVHCEAPIVAHLDGELQAPSTHFEITLRASALPML